MSPELRTIQPIDYQFSLEDEVIGSPWESRLYRGIDSDGKPVGLKVYQYALASAYQRRALSQVLRLQEIASIANQVSGQIVNPEGIGLSVSYDVVPLQEVGLINYQGHVVPCALVEIVEGPTLREAQTEVVNFLRSIGSMISVNDLMEYTTRELRRLTRISDIKLDAHNAKPNFANPLELKIRITDPCQLVGNIKV